MIGGHSARDSGRKYVGGTDWECRVIGHSDGRHGGDFRGSALRVGQMVLADFFADGDHDALPADHGAETESDRDGDLDPERDEVRGLVDVSFVILRGCPHPRRELQPCRTSGSAGWLR